MELKEMIQDSHELGFRQIVAKRRKRGFSLLEFAIVMTLGVLAAVGVMMWYTSANNGKNMQTALTELAAIQQGVRSLYGGSSTYTGLDNSIMVSSKALPVKMVQGSSGLRNAFSGAITVSPANSGGGANSGFSVKFDGVPQDSCVKMASQDLGRGLYSLTVNDSETRTAGTGTPPPFDPGSATSACNGGINSITWIFS